MYKPRSDAGRVRLLYLGELSNSSTRSDTALQRRITEQQKISNLLLSHKQSTVMV